MRYKIFYFNIVGFCHGFFIHKVHIYIDGCNQFVIDFPTWIVSLKVGGLLSKEKNALHIFVLNMGRRLRRILTVEQHVLCAICLSLLAEPYQIYQLHRRMGKRKCIASHLIYYVYYVKTYPYFPRFPLLR